MQGELRWSSGNLAGDRVLQNLVPKMGRKWAVESCDMISLGNRVSQERGNQVIFLLLSLVGGEQEYWVSFFQEWGRSDQQEVRSPEFDFLVCCGCLLSWASLFPSLCLSFFLCNIMLMSLCSIWVLSVELGWRDRQCPKFSLSVGSDCLWWWKILFICICLVADAQTSFMPCTWVDDNWENVDVFWVSSQSCFLHGRLLGKGHFRWTHAHGNHRHLFLLKIFFFVWADSSKWGRSCSRKTGVVKELSQH